MMMTKEVAMTKKATTKYKEHALVNHSSAVQSNRQHGAGEDNDIMQCIETLETVQ